MTPNRTRKFFPFDDLKSLSWFSQCAKLGYYTDMQTNPFKEKRFWSKKKINFYKFSNLLCTLIKFPLRSCCNTFHYVLYNCVYTSVSICRSNIFVSRDLYYLMLRDLCDHQSLRVSTCACTCLCGGLKALSVHQLIKDKFELNDSYSDFFNKK